MSKISTDTSKMTKGVTSKGVSSFNCGDIVATALNGVQLDAVKKIATQFKIDTEKYAHLNPGHQRMILGNMLRKAVRTNAAEMVKEAAMTEEAANSAAAAAFEDSVALHNPQKSEAA